LPKTYSAYLHAAATYLHGPATTDLHDPAITDLPATAAHKWFGYTEVKEIWYQRLFNFYPLYLAASGGAPLIIDNKAAFNNKYAIGVFAFLQTLYNKGYFSRENLSASDDPFVAKEIATKWTGPWEITYLHTIPDLGFSFGYFEPQVPDEHQGPVYTYADPKNIVLFSTCLNPQQAWNFIRTLVDKSGDLQLLSVTGQLPRRKNLETDPFYSDYFKLNPLMVPFAKQLPFVKGVDNCEVIVEVLDIISREYEECVVYGRKTPATAIRDAETAVNLLLANTSDL
jgi:multiple sugar transport system substrate-binding protein